MSNKTYQAESMAEALTQVKRELGRDAVILRTRNFRKGGLWGLWGGRPMWEITASRHADAPIAVDGAYVSDRAVASLSQASGAAMSGAIAADAEADAAAAPVHAQVGEIRRMVESLLSLQAGHGVEHSSQLRGLRTQLLAQEVTEEVADELIHDLSMQLTGQELADEPLVRARLMDLMVQKVQIVDPSSPPPSTGRARISVFIGPTGVGKTTTIAKLAANYKLREGRRVGMITIDTYRIAAVDQLKIYAEIIDVPLQVVLTAGELRQAIESMKDYDVLLIDTAGRSQHDRLRLGQLSSFLKAAQPDDIHLVIAATASRSTIVSTLERFLQLGVNRIIMTKLDEAPACGAVLSVAAVGKLPISYVTTGQDVPDDIHPADPARLARCIMEGSLYVHG